MATFEAWSPDPGDATHIGDFKAWRSGGHEYTYVGGRHPMATSAHSLLMHNADPAKGKQLLSKLDMDSSGKIGSIETNPEERRQGHATKLLNFAKHLSTKFEDFPEPKHSENLTGEGAAWANANGAENLSANVSKRQFMSRPDSSWGK